MLSTPLRSQYIRHFILYRNLDQFPRLFLSFSRTFLRCPCARFTKNVLPYVSIFRLSARKLASSSEGTKDVEPIENGDRYEKQSPLKKALCDRERIHVTGRIVYATLTCDSNRRKRDTVDVTRFIYAHT